MKEERGLARAIESTRPSRGIALERTHARSSGPSGNDLDSSAVNTPLQSRALSCGALACALALSACSPSTSSSTSADTAGGPNVVRLADAFDPGLVEGGVDVDPPEPIRLRFDGPLPEPPAEDESESEPPNEAGEPGEPGEPSEAGDDGESEPVEPEPDLTATYGFEALLDVEDLAVVDGLLTGTTGDIPVLRVGLADLDEEEPLHSVEIRCRVSEGGTLGLSFLRDAEIDREYERKFLRRATFWGFSSDVTASETVKRVTVDLTHMSSRSLAEARHMFLQPTDASGATFAIEEVRFVTRREHLARIASGIGWHGLGEVYREALALRAPERARIPLSVHAGAWLDLAIGAVGPDPATFRVHAVDAASGDETSLLRRTVTTPDRWEEVPLELDALAGRDVELVFSIDSPEPGTVGFFGTPVVRTRDADPLEEDGPRGVILILADTLRRDHLDAYGYERETAPTITRIAKEGALFLDPISQGTWTKVAVPALLTSTYPASNGIYDARHRLPDAVTTFAEAFQEAGYATFATSSVMFTGKLSNLQQGLDVLHERSSVGDLGHSSSKTARTYLDRMLAWIEAREGGPFYARLHVFDPHDPFPPYAPYGDIWSEGGALDAHDEDVEAITAWQEENEKEENEMPREREIVAAGVSPDGFVRREIDWYDESIRGMDVEIARLFERLEESGLADDVLVVLVSDHGEEFLEHGRHFHGNYTYGEMTNVPLVLWGPRWVPPGTVVTETVQTIDMMPTVLELAGLPVPEHVQGQSLVPLLGGPGTWTARPAISERRRPNFAREPDDDDTESHAIVDGGYRLVHHFTRPEGWPEYELFDHVADPTSLEDIAADHPDVVEDLSHKLDLWRRWAEANPLEGEGEGVDLTEEELAELDALGYGG